MYEEPFAIEQENKNYEWTRTFNIEELPRNTDLELQVIGSCILFKKALARCLTILKPNDFYFWSCNEAFRILTKMFNEDKPIDLVTFSEEAIHEGTFETMGGQPFLAEIMQFDVMPVYATIGYHARLIKKYSIRREMIYSIDNYVMLATDNTKDPEEIIDLAEKLFTRLFDVDRDENLPVSLSQIAPGQVEYIKKLCNGEIKRTGYKTNYADLDALITLEPGSLNIIAARPSMGKTALAMNIAQFGGDKSQPCNVLIFSLEMSKEQLTTRMLSAETQINLGAINAGVLCESEIQELEAAAQNFEYSQISICEASNLSISELRARAKLFKARKKNLELIIVDYIQLMTGSENQRGYNRQIEVAEISRGLKSLAVELSCPVIALSQLSRETEKRVEKKPQLSDLRDSGAIEQDADTVMLLYREDYYEQDNFNSEYSKSELRIAKNRNGQTGVCNLLFMKEYSRFTDYADEY